MLVDCLFGPVLTANKLQHHCPIFGRMLEL